MSYTVKFLNLVTSIADAGWEFLSRQHGRQPLLLDKPVGVSCRELLTSVGEATGTALAREILLNYQRMQREQKLDFFRVLRNDFSSDFERVLKSVENFSSDPNEINLQTLTKAAEPPRQELFRRLNMAPGGTAALVDMRADLLSIRKEDNTLDVVDADLYHLLVSWFNRGFLELREINWETSAAVLEKLIAYEAVHEIQGWEDLRRRVHADRRCFGFFHPSLPDEPLIFVEVALLGEVAHKVHPLIRADAKEIDPAKANTAIFYSISNCQKGLRGISFGNFLIKQVVNEIQRDFPKIKTFATLSPVPGFRDWLDNSIENGQLAEPEIALCPLRDLIDDPAWIDDEKITEQVRPVLMSLCANYLVLQKRKDRPIDPVARFHLNNGARLERLNWLADTSPRGMAQSAGMMVNYLYHPSQIISNHEEFARDGTVVASAQVTENLKKMPSIEELRK